MDLEKVESRIIREVRSVVPGLSVRGKTAAFWKFVPRRFRRMGLALGKTIWLPDLSTLSDEDRRRARLLFVGHELTHVLDRHRQGFRYNIKYALPNALTLICAQVALGAAALSFHFAPGVWAAVAALMLGIVLIPCPSPWRLAVERLAYTTSAYVMIRYMGFKRDIVETNLAECLSDAAYLGMVTRMDAKIEASIIAATIWLGDYSIVDDEMRRIIDTAFTGKREE